MDKQRDYIGDGVYTSFDGYQIWLAANHHENDVIAIEPNVMEALLRYCKRVWSEDTIKQLKEQL